MNQLDPLTLQARNLEISSRPPPQDDGHSTLSKRGQKNASFLSPEVEAIMSVFRDLFDPVNNLNGIVNLGVADNSLCRPELLDYFNYHRLDLEPAELTYADRFTTSARLLRALAKLYNDYTNDAPEGDRSPKPIKKVEPEHIAMGSGASGILDQLFWVLCEEGNGVLLSTPYYNAFDHDLTARASTKIIPVQVPQSGIGGMLAVETVKHYEEALLAAQKEGIKVKVLLLCNPHNPSGGIYPRDTVVALAKLAAKYQLHLVSDEIYARSCYKTNDIPLAEIFHSVLSIDLKKEAGLEEKYVHVVSSASKDFAINGFRLGLLISQSNKDLHRAMTAVGILAQSAAPAVALWYTWLEDKPFLEWYLEENRRRMSKAYQYVTDFMKHYQIPYVPSSSGHFFLVDFRKQLDIQSTEEGERKKEQDMVKTMIEKRVFVAPGTQYHHPIPGFFRLTFTQDPKALKEGLKRLEQALGFTDGFEEKRDWLDLKKGGKPCPL